MVYQPNCSLQLDLNSMLSRDSTIGIIWAQGELKLKLYMLAYNCRCVVSCLLVSQFFNV